MIIKFITFLALAYFALHVLIVAMQRSLIFIPSYESPGTNKPESAERIRINVEDGIEIEAWWIESPHEPSLNLTLLYCHGNGATLGQLSGVAEIFRALGLRVLLFDYRGYGASTVAPLSEEALMQDARAAYDWLRLKKGIPEREIVIWGHSLGAAVASRLATERSPSALITEGAFTSLFDMARNKYPWLILHRSFLFDEFATASHLARRTMPLLMFHAEHDSVIPRKIGEQAFAAAREPKQWVTISNTDHNDFPSVEKEYRETIRGFLSRIPQ